MDISVIYEDENFIALNKPAGLLVHPAGKEEEYTLVDWIETNYPEALGVGDPPAGGRKRPGIVHRLDKDTSGIILVARNQNYFEYLKNLFKQKEIKKTYRAIALGHLKEQEGTIEEPISIKAGSVKRTTHGGKDTKSAITEYRVLEEFKDFTHLEIFPKTGRTHQIRVHLNSIGHPVAGDKLYGGKKAKASADRQMLHALSLELPVQSGKRVVLTADLPQDFSQFLRSLEK